MNVVLGVQRDGHWREVRLDDYSTPQGEELAQADALDWIKGLRHARVDGRRMRERFTFRGDSLWWFTELYLHKEQAILTIMRTIVAFDALIDAERPQRVRWVRGDRVLTSVDPRAESDPTRAVSRSPRTGDGGGPGVGWPCRCARRRFTRRRSVRGGGTALAAAQPGFGDRIRPSCVLRERSAATAPGGEWYIGSVLQQIASRVPAGVAAPGGRRTSPEFSRTTVVAGVRGRRHTNARAILARSRS